VSAERLRPILERLFEGQTLGPDQLAEDAEWVNPADAVETGTRYGAAGFNAAIVNVFSTWDDVHFDVERMIENGDEVVALGVVRGHVHGPGMEVESPHGQVWTFRDGLAVRMCWFNTHDETLEAAGLQEG
jgi:ketosteroid isomerase-like protein